MQNWNERILKLVEQKKEKQISNFDAFIERVIGYFENNPTITKIQLAFNVIEMTIEPDYYDASKEENISLEEKPIAGREHGFELFHSEEEKQNYFKELEKYIRQNTLFICYHKHYDDMFEDLYIELPL